MSFEKLKAKHEELLKARLESNELSNKYQTFTELADKEQDKYNKLLVVKDIITRHTQYSIVGQSLEVDSDGRMSIVEEVVEFPQELRDYLEEFIVSLTEDQLGLLKEITMSPYNIRGRQGSRGVE